MSPRERSVTLTGVRRALPLALLVTLIAPPAGALDTAHPAPPRPAPQRPTPRGACGLRAGDAFTGRYLCAQGVTDLALRVLSAQGASLRVEFVFNHAPSRAAGRYTLTGSCEGGRVALSPEAWVERPPGYIMVGMEGPAPRAGRFDGRITHPSCGWFSLAAR